MDWLQVPLSDMERAAIGAPPGTEKFTRTATDGGTLVAYRVNAHGWQLNVMYLPTPSAVTTEAGASEIGGRSPTHDELLSARWDLVPPEVMMMLPFYPDGHPEARLTNRANLVLVQLQIGPVSRPSGIIMPN